MFRMEVHPWNVISSSTETFSRFTFTMWLSIMDRLNTPLWPFMFNRRFGCGRDAWSRAETTVLGRSGSVQSWLPDRGRRIVSGRYGDADGDDDEEDDE